MLNKHKLFLLCAKWIPVVTAIGILVTNTIAYYGCNDIVVDIFNFNAISNIDAGNSNLNEEEMEELVKTLSVLNKGVKRISKAYACEHILHCSPATFDNYVRAGIIPKGKKEIGFNELSWSLKDFDGVKLQRIHKK